MSRKANCDIFNQAIGLLALVGCATFGRPTGEVVVVVETFEPVDRLEFIDPDSGEPFQLSAVPVGTSLYKDAAKPGHYCLVRYVVGEGNYGKIYGSDGEICFDVTEGSQAYAGHISIGPDARATLRHDPACLANQLAEHSSLGSIAVTPCGK